MQHSDLIFGLMAAIGKKEYSIHDFKYLLDPFATTESCLRTTLFRMKANKLLSSRREGKNVFYFFSQKAKSISDNLIHGFKMLDWSNWNKTFWGVHFSIPENQKPLRHRIRKKLSKYRFALLYDGFWIRPFHEQEKLEVKLKEIFTNNYCKAIQFSPYIDFSNSEIQTLWKLRVINQQFHRVLYLLREKLKIIKNLSPRQALVEKMDVGNKVVNIIFKDPLLPPLYLPEDWQGVELKRIFSRWEKNITGISRPYWERILK